MFRWSQMINQSCYLISTTSACAHRRKYTDIDGRGSAASDRKRCVRLRGQTPLFSSKQRTRQRIYSGAPGGRLAAEGKAILKPRHKSADELQRQLEQLPHRSSMPGPRQTSALMCPCTLSGAQNKCRKSSFLQAKRRRRAFCALPSRASRPEWE